jgi:zinc and cadmium transporter
MVGVVSFFILEKFIHWHSHVEEHDGNNPKEHVAYLSLAGDSIHNFIDGAAIGVTFLTSIPLGIATTIAIIAHEIPHELSDFFLLLYGGFSNKKALWYNFLSALTAILGTVTIFVFSGSILKFSPYFVGFAAGNFLYIAASDLIPELHTKKRIQVSVFQTLLLIAGIVVMFFVSTNLKG